MISTKQQQKGQEILSTIVKKSWEDDAFKQELIKNPKTAILSLGIEGVTISDNQNIVVEDQSNSNFIYINIPKKINLDEIELTDKELEAVSGGDGSDNGLNLFKWIGYGAHAIVDGVTSIFE